MQLAEFVKAENVQYPAILAQRQGSNLKLLINAEALKAGSKDHAAFLDLLVKRANEEDIPLTLRDTTSASSAL